MKKTYDKYSDTILGKHFEELSNKNNVTFCYARQMNGLTRFSARCLSRKIKVPYIRNERDYAVAMHELGHILTHKKDMLVRTSECAAWAWAIENSLEWTENMRKKMAVCLKTYLRVFLEQDLKSVPKNNRMWKMASVSPLDIKALYSRRRYKETTESLLLKNEFFKKEMAAQ